MLSAWGYSASARGRKPRGQKTAAKGKTARQRLEDTLREIFGASPSPVPSLYTKLAGSTPVTVKDARRILTAMICSWPEPLGIGRKGKSKDEAVKRSRELADRFIRELLSELSGGRSLEWTDDDMEVRVFKLVSEERIGARQFIREAGQKEGALIVAGAKFILIGTHPVNTIREFHSITSQFISENQRGILIFIFDGAIFEAGIGGFGLIYNIGLLSSAMTAFALFPPDYDFKRPVERHRVDWSRWRALCKRCCVAIRKPPLIDPETGVILKHNMFDEYIAEWKPEQTFEILNDFQGFIRFESNHVLPRNYPQEFQDLEVYDMNNFYWDVLVRPSKNEPEGLRVEYFTPPPRHIRETSNAQQVEKNISSIDRVSGRGRQATNTFSIEDDLFYVVRRKSPGARYDDAQRTVYMAARGRLGLDKGETHQENMNAAAGLRDIGYEVLPISILLSLFPRALHFGAIQTK